MFELFSSLFESPGTLRARVFGVLALALLAGAGGCSKSGGAEAAAEVASAPAVRPQVLAVPALSKLGPGDPDRGEELVTEHQCNRCHAGTGQPVPAREDHCVNCHREILSDAFPAPAAKLAAWKPNVRAVRAVPSLSAIGARLEREWVASFLLEPHDVRPMLEPSMPRLGLSQADARDIAAFLTAAAPRERAAEPGAPAGDPQRGRHLMEERGCSTCHVFSGVPAFATTPSREQALDQEAILLAPDLRYVRDRFSEGPLNDWLSDPRGVKPDTLMPPPGLDAGQVRDVAAYLLRATLLPETKRPALQRLPVLERPVRFTEVDAAVFRKTCRHCHGDPSVARGDGGPGNTGGFGFKARGIDFSSYRAIASGYLDSKGRRRSLFETTEDGVPRLLAALIARHDEASGRPHATLRGMPLGLPALSPEAIQLVESWIAQGRQQ